MEQLALAHSNRLAGNTDTVTTVVPFSEAHADAWDAFVRNCKDGTLFHLQGWRQAVENTFGHRQHYLIAFKGGQITGVLPLMEIRSLLFGRSLVAVPFAVYGGVLAAEDEARAALINEGKDLARKLRVDYLELRCLDSSTQPQGTENGLLKKDLYVTFRRPIFPSLAENLQAIPRKQRAMTRKGEKAGLISRIGRDDLLDGFYTIYSTNVRDLGTPVFPIRFFRSLLKAFPDAFIFSVWKDQKMVAAVFTFVYGKELLPYYGAGLRDYFHLSINDFMYWELMKYGCENGYSVFDFGRSKKGTGSYSFKKNWGFEPVDLEYTFFLVRQDTLPNVSPLNPRYRMMVETWKRLPLPVANWLGPKLVRSIP